MWNIILHTASYRFCLPLTGGSRQRYCFYRKRSKVAELASVEHRYDDTVYWYDQRAPFSQETPTSFACSDAHAPQPVQMSDSQSTVQNRERVQRSVTHRCIHEAVVVTRHET